ncbi:MAG: ABC transporter ATP-binding protein [Solirubrobacterales bacterium]|nr:ABC transporter ATP-binding protein [Solirubrobacterales bacterium]
MAGAGDTAAHGRKPLISLDGVSRHYEIGGGIVKALDAIDLEVGAGEFVVILGASGSGKTTLLNVIGALDVPTAGRIEIGGNEVTGASRRELFALRRHEIGFIFQSFNLFPGLTALENVEFGADVAGRGDARAAAGRVLEQVGLADRARHFPHELSGGEQQRVAIARALAAGNPIVLADEPTGELDFETGVQILELLHDVTHTSGTAVLVVTHNREIARVADRIVELSSGRIVSDEANVPAAMSDLRW